MSSRLYRQQWVLLVLAFWPATALAGRTSGTVKGHLVSQTEGACNVGYSSYCSSGNCICDLFEGTISGNPIGKGSALLDVTVDQGAELSGGRTCFPLFGVLGIETSRDTEVINAVGSVCETTGNTEMLSGGFGISQSARGAGAWGTLTGSFNVSNGAGLVNYSGTTF